MQGRGAEEVDTSVLIEELEPVLRRIVREELVSSKVIIGATAIKQVMGIKSTKTLMNYYNNHGLPMVKGGRGFWTIHSDAIKDWMNTRSLMARKARELGFQVNSRRGAGRYPRLERLTAQELAQVIAGIKEDNAR